MEILTRTASGYDFDDTASSASSCVDDDERAYGGRRRFDDSDSEADSDIDSEADSESDSEADSEADPHSYWTSTAAAVMPVAETKEEDEESKHKFGLCGKCSNGLDDKSDFVLHKMRGDETILICNQCWHGMWTCDLHNLP